MKNKTPNKYKSIIRYFQNKNRISDDLLVLINSMTLEELIAIKLELSTKLLKNRLYGIDIWRNTGYIIKEAVLVFAISTTNSKKDAARFLGLTERKFNLLIKQYKVKDFFKNDENFI
jgi:hypothetical protein